MFVGMIKKNIRKAINELFAEGIVVDVVGKAASLLATVPKEVLGRIDSVSYNPETNGVEIKFRKEF